MSQLGVRARLLSKQSSSRSHALHHSVIQLAGRPQRIRPGRAPGGLESSQTGKDRGGNIHDEVTVISSKFIKASKQTERSEEARPYIPQCVWEWRSEVKSDRFKSPCIYTVGGCLLLIQFQ